MPTTISFFAATQWHSDKKTLLEVWQFLVSFDILINYKDSWQEGPVASV